MREKLKLRKKIDKINKCQFKNKCSYNLINFKCCQTLKKIKTKFGRKIMFKNKVKYHLFKLNIRNKRIFEKIFII